MADTSPSKGWGCVNPIMEIDKGERHPFPYERGPLLLDLGEEKKGKPWASPTKEWDALMALN